ncbi:uncharacterized protein Triagg1_9059 [Trichoderma aggressivum f. europaeum]|uniref:3'-5' exonuclease domain-containing protein n=1 Tax=Trichoderma aggressivum f. europaeum TaxID=173218 RepID=A0AAE1I7J0_9HYPO|nr:hypothetical protein Triagg1_9059 [Trichoderma aggressivum f. europaeum]
MGFDNKTLAPSDESKDAALALALSHNMFPCNGVNGNSTMSSYECKAAAVLYATTPDGPAATQWIDNVPALSKLVDGLTGLPVRPPSIYVDLEGQNLSRYGTISLLLIHVRLANTTYLIDVQSLGNKCFSTAGETGWTLKAILESTYIPKVFFDVRSDSDALFAIFDITLNDVIDLQLMEFAVCPRQGKIWVQGFKSCVHDQAELSRNEKPRWSETKKQGSASLAPEQSGSFQVSHKSPLQPVLLGNCAQDLSVMPCLWAHYDSQMEEQLRGEVIAASAVRVWESQAPDYSSRGRHMALAPLSMIDASDVDKWRRLHELYHPCHGRCALASTAPSSDAAAGSLFSSAVSPVSGASTATSRSWIYSAE